MTATLQQLAPTPETDPQAWSSFKRQLEHIEQCDRTLLANLKSALREGLLAFEQHEDQVIEQGKTQLVEALKKIPIVTECYYTALTHDVTDE